MASRWAKSGSSAIGGREDALLVKYLFTSQRLSVQVHPDDDAATAAGHDRGKDEAWLILDVEPGAEIAIGLKKQLSTEALKASALDGSIVDRLDWREVAPGDAFYSPAGTLHAIGAGLTLLEVQQNADITYRFFDYGRDRELHLDEAVAAANTASSPNRSIEQPLGDGRSLLVQGPKFTVERWREGRGRLRASRAAPLWLITLTGPAHANGQELENPRSGSQMMRSTLSLALGVSFLSPTKGLRSALSSNGRIKVS